MTVGARLEALDGHVRLRRDRLHAIQEIGRVLFFGQNRLQIRQPPFESVTCCAELRQLLRGGEALVDVGVQRDELRFARRHVGVRGHLVVVEKHPAAGDGEHHEGADLRIPR